MDFYIKDYGAVSDGKSLNTVAIQRAIDACAKEGGGRVIVSGGVYMTGSITLKTNVNLHIEGDSVLLGSPDVKDFPEKVGLRHVNTERLPRWKNAAVIFAEECENISITGNGKIDANGTHFVTRKPDPHEEWDYIRTEKNSPPRVVFFTGCKNVKIEDIRVENLPSGWSFWIHDCDYVSFDKVKVYSEVGYPNNDGIHINSSRNVTVSNCSLTCGDDCIIVRANNASLAENKVCEKVTVTNCNLTSYSAGIRIGWMNDGVIRNCTFSNIVMTDTSCGISVVLPRLEIDKNNYLTADRGREATHIENLLFNNIVMDKTAGSPIKMILDKSEDVMIDAVRNIRFSGIHANGPKMPLIHGRPSCRIENIYFDGCSFTVTDGREFDNLTNHGSNMHGDTYHISLEYVDNIRFNNTDFSVKR